MFCSFIKAILLSTSFYIWYRSKEQHWNKKFSDNVGSPNLANNQNKMLCVSVDWPLWHINQKPTEVSQDYSYFSSKTERTAFAVLFPLTSVLSSIPYILCPEKELLKALGDCLFQPSLVYLHNRLVGWEGIARLLLFHAWQWNESQNSPDCALAVWVFVGGTTLWRPQMSVRAGVQIIRHDLQTHLWTKHRFLDTAEDCFQREKDSGCGKSAAWFSLD